MHRCIGAQCNLIAQCTPGTICVWLVVCALCSVHWSGDIWSDWLQCSVLCRLPDSVEHNQGLIWCIFIHNAWCRVPGAWCSDMWSGWNFVYFFYEQCTVLRCVVRVYFGVCWCTVSGVWRSDICGRSVIGRNRSSFLFPLRFRLWTHQCAIKLLLLPCNTVGSKSRSKVTIYGWLLHRGAMGLEWIGLVWISGRGEI